MRFEQLECLVQIAETGSFTEAAKRLYLTPQAVSMSMKQLERELGQQLIIRENNKTVFTLYGEEIVESARKILQEKESMLQKTQASLQDATPLSINIGSTSCVANMTLPDIIEYFVQQKKKTSIKIGLLESLSAVLEQVESGEKDIGLISMNIVEFERKFQAYETELQMEILARDELVGVINRKEYSGNQEYIDADKYSSQLRTMYNVEPIDERRIDAWSSNMVRSNDADFHRTMLEKAGTMVTMSGLSYQHFFNQKKYIALPLKDIDVTILHAAVYRKDAEPHIQELVRMIRKEMYLK